jgi:hypothetical protein
VPPATFIAADPATASASGLAHPRILPGDAKPLAAEDVLKRIRTR